MSCCRMECSVVLILFAINAVQGVPSQVVTTGCEQRKTLRGSSGIISSPDYPSYYSSSLRCTWVIKSSPNSLISISFLDVDIEDDFQCQMPPCCKDNWLKIGSFHNKSIRVYCGHNLQITPLVLTDDEIWIKLHVRNALTGGRGFKLKYLITPIVECGNYEFRCDNGMCVHMSQRCNGKSECGDNSDERNCIPPTNHATGLCPANMTWCGDPDGTCFGYSEKCDKVFNCPNGEDEINCIESCKNKIQCESRSGCYDWRDRCNGIAQCNDYSDEKNCNMELCRPEAGGFLCSNLRCIRGSWQCDQTNDCGDNSDEMNCVKNSVITAAIMGSLICGLLLVIAVGCTCRLYALRIQDRRTSRCISTLSRIEREMMQREPPPPYTMAINDPVGHCFQQTHVGLVESQCYSSRRRMSRRIRRLRRHRRCSLPPPPPPLQSLAPLHEPNINTSSSHVLTDSLLSQTSEEESMGLASSLNSPALVTMDTQETIYNSYLQRLGKDKTCLTSNILSFSLATSAPSELGSVSGEAFGTTFTSVSELSAGNGNVSRQLDDENDHTDDSLLSLTSEIDDDCALLLLTELRNV